MTISALYDEVARLQGTRPWGRLLDAGTGASSMRWITGLETEAWTAVTGSKGMAKTVETAIAGQQRPQDRLVVGNWMDPALLAGDTYNTVVADYLLGAIEGFAPYWQDQLFTRLRPLVGERLYVIGLEPYVPYSPTDPAGRMVNAIGRLRDACLLLAGDRPYREYPLDWTTRQLEQAGFRILDARRYSIVYRDRFIHSQLDMCSQRLARLADRPLAAAMESHVSRLRREALTLAEQLGGLAHGHDYVIACEPG